jgi:hypothetical protein
MCHTLSSWVSYFDDRHNIVGRVLELAHVDIEVTQLVLLRLLQHQVAPLAHSIDALQVAGGVEVGVRSSRQRNMRNTRGGCGVLGHGGVFGVAVEREGRVAMVGRVFVASSAVVAVVPAGEEAHVIGCACIIMQLVPYLVGRRRAAAGSAGRPGWIWRGGADVAFRGPAICYSIAIAVVCM